MKKSTWILGGAVVLVLAVAALVWRWMPQQPPQPQTVSVSPVIEDVIKPVAPEQTDSGDQNQPPAGKPTAGNSVVIPGERHITVPFVVQAPFANWEPPYNETCEEASVLMVDRFYKGVQALSEDEMKRSIDDLAAWGEQHFSGEVDTTAKQTAQYFTDKLGYDDAQVVVAYDVTVDDIKAVLAQGYPVIVPAAGRDLGNEHFRNPGPIYHMLVITGYDDKHFYTNDPGTRFGQDFVYDQDTLYNAMHDLTAPKENIEEGRKVMIVVKPLVP